MTRTIEITTKDCKNLLKNLNEVRKVLATSPSLNKREKKESMTDLDGDINSIKELMGIGEMSVVWIAHGAPCVIMPKSPVTGAVAMKLQNLVPLYIQCWEFITESATKNPNVIRMNVS